MLLRPWRMRTVVRGKKAQRFVNVLVGHGRGFEAGGLVHGERPRQAVDSVGGGREQLSAVLRHREVGEVGALPYQPEQRERARPGTVAFGHGGTMSGVSLEPLQQSVEAVALMVEGVLARQ